jgi:enoyl-CoA hydratase/carnithine racemase
MASQMLTELHGSTLVLTLSDPATRNSLSPQASAAGLEALARAEADPEVRCVVLRGDGEHFCGGGNLPRLLGVRDGDPQAQWESMGHLHDFVEAVVGLPKPVIAAVEGFAAGAGVGLVLACDQVVAAEDAQFVLSYGRVGLSPDAGGSWQLARRVPRAVALRMLWLPSPQGARQWQQLGLVNDLVDRGHALPHALQLGEQLAAMAPNALASAKQLMHEALLSPLREQLDREREHFVRNLFHANGGEGIRAFLDKRAPRFTNR